MQILEDDGNGWTLIQNLFSPNLRGASRDPQRQCWFPGFSSYLESEKPEDGKLGFPGVPNSLARIRPRGRDLWRLVRSFSSFPRLSAGLSSHSFPRCAACVPSCIPNLGQWGQPTSLLPTKCHLFPRLRSAKKGPAAFKSIRQLGPSRCRISVGPHRRSLLPAPSAPSSYLVVAKARNAGSRREGTGRRTKSGAGGREPGAPGMLSGTAGWVASRAAPGSVRRRRRRRRERAGGRRPRLVSLSAPGSGG